MHLRLIIPTVVLVGAGVAGSLTAAAADKITLCHWANGHPHTITVSRNAAGAHFQLDGQGQIDGTRPMPGHERDNLGACPAQSPTPTPTRTPTPTPTPTPTASSTQTPSASPTKEPTWTASQTTSSDPSSVPSTPGGNPPQTPTTSVTPSATSSAPVATSSPTSTR